jgi:16S rRNA (guanine527-N7)-methyltransferase
VPDTDQGAPLPPTLLAVLGEARDVGFLGPGPLETHLSHARGFAALARRYSPASANPPRLLDLGSGGGLPGLVVAVLWPESTLVLLDAGERRADFLRRAVQRCELGDRVSVIHERAEVAGRDAERRAHFDGVVVRSFGPPGVVAECAAPFLRVGGCVIVSEPPGASEQAQDSASRWPAEGLAQTGLEPVEFVRESYGYQVLRQAELCPDRLPRRNGVPAKHPLF